MGTFWCVKVIDVSRTYATQLKEKIQTQLNTDDLLLSTWKKNSVLMRFNLSYSTLPWPINETIADIITKSLRIGYKTNGAMDITIGKIVNMWGFGSDKQSVNIPTQAAIDSAKIFTGLNHLTVINKYNQQYLQKDIPSMFIDLSTVGEGYAVDHLAVLMAQEEIKNYLISVGGALISSGMKTKNKPWLVGIHKPTDEQNAVQAIVNINGCGISTSGSYYNYYELNKKHISHIINPKTGRPIEHNTVSVTVISQTAFEADAWDTGLMALGIEKAKSVVCKHGLAAYMIIKEGNKFKTWISPKFKNYLVSTLN